MKNNDNNINVMVYGLPNRYSGGLAVINNLYYDFFTNKDAFPDIHWFFIVGVDSIESSDNITVVNEERYLKTWLHRFYYNKIIAPRFIRDNDIVATITLNMNTIRGKTPNIISFHNVLPLHHIGFDVFDSLYWIIKQRLINHIVVKSLKKAKAILIPSDWLRKELVNKFGIQDSRIHLSQIPVPEISKLLIDSNTDSFQRSGDEVVFLYPSTSYLYKNHKVVMNAVRKLKMNNVRGYKVVFTGYAVSGKNAIRVKDDIIKEDLPIEIRDNMTKEELAAAYRKDVLLFPSKIETDAFPLLECMACGGEILTSDFPFSREALKGYDRAVFFDADDHVTLAEIMKETIKLHDSSACGHVPERKDIRPRSETIVPIIRRIAGR